MGADQTEQATARRKEKAREKGDRARSKDLLAGCAMLAGVATLRVAEPRMLTAWSECYHEVLRFGTEASWESDTVLVTMSNLRGVLVTAMLPVCLVLFAALGASLVSGLAQSGGLAFHFEALQPKFERFNPATNIKNLVSLNAASRLGKSLIPAAILGVLAAKKIQHESAMAVLSTFRLSAMCADAYDLLFDAAWVLFLWSAVDFAIEWRSWERRLRMSKQELRDEFKESEGNPQIRSRIRGLQRQMRRRKLKADVSHASVVITNPTHYAVALSFDFETMEAPKVLTKGRNLLAEQIKKEARWAGVPIMENPPLARSLYRTVEAGQAIPVDLYAAVAGILAFLYRERVEEKVRRERAVAEHLAGAAESAQNAAGMPQKENR